MPTDKILELLLQIPLAGVNIIVVVLFLRYLEEQDKRQKTFLTEQRHDNNAAVASLAKEIAVLDADINALKVVTIEHNALMLSALQEMRSAINRRRSTDYAPKP